MLTFILFIIATLLGLCQRTIYLIYDTQLAGKWIVVTNFFLNCLTKLFTLQHLLSKPTSKLIYAGCLCLFIFPSPDEFNTVYFVTEGPCIKNDAALFDDYFANGMTVNLLDWDLVHRLASETDSVEFCVLNQVYSKELNRFIWVYDFEYNQLLKEQITQLANEPVTRENWKSRI